jgi:hypothetical protein
VVNVELTLPSIEGRPAAGARPPSCRQRTHGNSQRGTLACPHFLLFFSFKVAIIELDYVDDYGVNLYSVYELNSEILS